MSDNRSRLVRSRLAFLIFAFLFESPITDGARANGGAEWKIILGETAHERAHPFFAHLLIEKSDSYFSLCGSVQIAGRFFLTAAHCVYESKSVNNGYFLVTPNVFIDSRNGVETRASTVRMHPGYLGENKCPRDNDIAVLRTAHDVPGPVAKLPPYRDFGYALPPSERLIAIGHGRTEHGTTSKQLLQTNISTPRACTQYPTCSVGADFCAGPYDPTKCLSVGVDSPSLDMKCQDTCQGDSGGPLFLPGNATDDAVVIGLTARGQGCGMLYSVKNQFPIPAVYTDVGLHLEWIETMMKEFEHSSARQNSTSRVVATLLALFFLTFANI